MSFLDLMSCFRPIGTGALIRTRLITVESGYARKGTTVPDSCRRGFDLPGRDGRRRGVRHALRPPQPRSLLPGLQDDGGTSSLRRPGAALAAIVRSAAALGPGSSP